MAGKWRRDADAKERDRIRARERRAKIKAVYGKCDPNRVYVQGQPVSVRVYDPEDFSHPDSDVRLGP